ncbi:PKD domain-containing protein [Methanosarcina sp.]|uniref:PKD domain-containing protein n=1 Tax=Methanosarcina sp. TaxID=2213 RepID=UPI003C78AFF0
MEEIKRNGTRRGCALIGVLGITVLALLILALSTASAATAQNTQLTITETQITHSGKAYNDHPDIYGDRIVWSDQRNEYGHPDIYVYDLSTQRETQITHSGSALSPTIYGDRIVWSEGRNNSRNIYMYDLSTQQETQISQSLSASSPAIYGDKIVWSDLFIGQSTLFMYDLSTKKETQIIGSGYASSPAIYDNKIVWCDNRKGLQPGSGGTYVYNLLTQQRNQISFSSSALSPAIYGDRIVWSEASIVGDSVIYDKVYLYNLSTRQKTQINQQGAGENPDIYGDRIVWMDGLNGYHIVLYDLSTSQEISTQDHAIDPHADGLYPAIYGDRIVWRHGYENADIYMGTISYKETEPVLPLANFSSNVTQGYVPLSVQFTDLSENATSRSWDFKNAGIIDSTEEAPVHVYMNSGTYTVNLTASNENGTDSRNATINVLKVTPTVTWSNPADIIQGTPLSSTQLNAVASVPGTFAYTPAEGTVLSAGTQTLHVDFTPTDTANYNTTSKDVTINVLTPAQKIEQTISMVQSLDLNSGQSNNLIVKLNEAVKSLNLGKTNESINKLNSFINEVKGYINSGLLSQEEGQALIDDANSVINTLSPK